MKTKLSPRQGFSLLEVLVAVTIFVGAIAVLSRLVTLGLENAEYSKMQAEGISLIESRFHELDAGLIDNSSVSDQTDDSFPDWQWSLTSESTSTNLYLIRVTATHTGTTQRSFTMTRYWFDAVAAQQTASDAKSAAQSAESNSSSSSSSSSASSSSSSSSSSKSGGS